MAFNFSVAAANSALAAAKAFLLGSTSQKTSKNLIILITHAQRPAAAADFDLINSESHTFMSRVIATF